MKEYKTINGTTYEIVHKCRILHSAREHVKKLRAQGKDAVERKVGKGKYHVYVRSKK
jgi:hypothetical protein